MEITGEQLSSCCGAPMDELCNDDTGFCSDCHDHCEYLSECEKCGEYGCSCEPDNYSKPWQLIAKGGAVIETLPNHAAAMERMRELRGKVNHAEPVKDDVTRFTDGEEVVTDRGIIVLDSDYETSPMDDEIQDMKTNSLISSSREVTV